MVDEDDDPPLESRPPTLKDLTDLCDALNSAGARYIVVGGMAMIQLGFVRATEDIDLLVETSEANFDALRMAMLTLPDQAIREVSPTDLEDYVVIRVADEIIVDLMARACGVDYQTAAPEAVITEVNGIPIPFASPELMWKLKQTLRQKDAVDRQFLARILTDRED